MFLKEQNVVTPNGETGIDLRHKTMPSCKFISSLSSGSWGDWGLGSPPVPQEPLRRLVYSILVAILHGNAKDIYTIN